MPPKPKNNNKLFEPKRISIWDQRGFLIGIGAFILALILLLVTQVNFSGNLSHLQTSILSGSREGNYFSLVEKIRYFARRQKAQVKNITTQGSIDNKKKLEEASESCLHSFALVQDGISWGKDTKLQLIAKLPSTETLFILGKKANTISSIRDLKGLRIGIGPKGSGSANLTEQLSQTIPWEKWKTILLHLETAQQIAALEKGDLDLGIFIIHPQAKLIRNAIRKKGLQIASLEEYRVLAQRLPAFQEHIVMRGYYDPTEQLPPTDKKTMQVGTLLVANRCPSRADIMGVLSLLSSAFPNLVAYQNREPNATGLPYADTAQLFFQNNGPEIVDHYLPEVASVIPIKYLVQILMGISILFNVMSMANKFRLWRIDANRVELEAGIAELRDKAYQVENQQSYQEAIKSLLLQLEKLQKKTRQNSLSMVVPMGGEMAYRYQEELIEEDILELKDLLG